MRFIYNNVIFRQNSSEKLLRLATCRKPIFRVTVRSFFFSIIYDNCYDDLITIINRFKKNSV